jgi:hypothetical protein
MYALLSQYFSNNSSIISKNSSTMKIIQKTILRLSLFGLFGILLLSSCSKDPVTPTPPAAENGIIDKAFPSASYDVTTVTGASTYYEMGFKFSVNKAGKVTKMGVKTPETGTYRVTLWDADSRSVLATVSCNHSNSLTFTIVSIGATALVPNKNYYITFRTLNQNRYSITPKSGTIPFPLQATSSISLLDYGYYSVSSTTDDGSVPKFPNLTGINSFARGFPEFEFQPD